LHQPARSMSPTGCTPGRQWGCGSTSSLNQQIRTRGRDGGAGFEAGVVVSAREIHSFQWKVRGTTVGVLAGSVARTGRWILFPMADDDVQSRGRSARTPRRGTCQSRPRFDDAHDRG
jgi:hypothetical protein